MAERRSRSLGLGFGWGRRYEDEKEPPTVPAPVASPGETSEPPPPPQPPRSAYDVTPEAEPIPTEGSVSFGPARTITPETPLSKPVDTGVEEGEVPVWEGRRLGEMDDDIQGWGRRGERSLGRRMPREPGMPGQPPRNHDDRRFPDPEEARLLCRIQEAEFRAIDWMLAADLRPNDREILNNYNEAARQAHELMRQYEERFGAFMWMHTGWPARRHTGPFAVEGEEYFAEEPA